MNNNLIIAHRGIYNNKNIPENSILAFKEALKFDYAIELDIEMTKDNVLIVFHDKNLKRMTIINNDVKNMTYNEIKNLYLLNTKERIPTLEEVLKLVNNKVLLLIEVKKDKRYKIILNNLNELLSKYNNYMVQSFDIKSLYYINRNYNNYNKGILLSANSRKICWYLPLFVIFKIININFISISKTLVDNKKYTKYINKIPTYIWTIKSKEELNKYINKYTGFVCDNLPYT